MEISQGNLNYHFKKRDEIIENLYYSLVENIDNELLKFKDEDITLDLLINLSTSIMSAFYDYRFFSLDFVQIMRNNKTIKSHYIKLSKTREKQFLDLFNVLVDKEILRKEVLDNEYVNLYKRFRILADFWISSSQVTNKIISKKVIKEYSEIINQAIYPYLTEKEKVTYLVAIALQP